MVWKISIVAAVLVFGLSAAAVAAPLSAGASCRTVHSGALDRVCRWRMAKGEVVDVYYGPSSPTAAPEPPHLEAGYAPAPVYYADPAYDDYGYAPFVYGVGRWPMRDRRRTTKPVTFGPGVGAHGRFRAAFETGHPRGRGG